MAYYSKETKLTNLPMMSNGAGTLSKDSYVLTEVTKIVPHDGYSDVTFKHSLYGKSTKQRSVHAYLTGNDLNNSVSKTVTVTTSFTSLLTLTETVSCIGNIETTISATLTYEDSSVIGGYGITTDSGIMSRAQVSFVTFGNVSSYPSSMKYGETGTVTTDKSSDYRLEFYDTSRIKRYTVSFTGTSVDFIIPITVFQETGGNLTIMKCFEEAQGIDICEVDLSCSVSETACSIGIQAVRSSSDADPSLVTITIVGKSAASSTSRTVTIYAKETSASSWTTLGTISPAETSFSETFTADLDIDYAWDIYATLSDDYTSVESTKVRIYSRSYIMDVRTDGKGIAFGGTAANQNELYCGFKNLRADNITPSDITGIANLIYPVGSIYMSTNATSPATLFGGTWERIQDRFLLAAGSIYAAGDRDGEATHMLKEAELPDHKHTFTTDSAGDHTHKLGKTKDSLASGSKYDKPSSASLTSDRGFTSTSEGAHTHTGTTDGAGGTQPHNNMPPYLVVNVWKRTA